MLLYLLALHLYLNVTSSIGTLYVTLAEKLIFWLHDHSLCHFSRGAYPVELT